MTSRGINYWQSEDGKERRLLFSINSFLQADRCAHRTSIPTFGIDGTVDLRAELPRGEKMGWNNNSPGKVWKNLLILGSDDRRSLHLPARATSARTTSSPARESGSSIPFRRPGEFGYETWPKDAYQYVGGANNWGSISIDDQRGIVYVPTGSATYDFYGADRLGQNLFANCLLALDARTGKRLWHFQTVHHDLWDYDNVSAPQLVTVRHNGQRVDAVAFAGKTGFLYVFNRVTGAPLWPIEERPVPKSDVPGEQAWPTQPFPTRPAPFARQTFTVDDVNPWLGTPEQYAAMKERVAKARNEGLFTPPALVDTISMPGNQGGSNFGTTAANPQKGLVFVVNVNQVAILRLEDVRTRTVKGGVASALEAGLVAYLQHCSSCHGANLQGAAGGAPSLVAVTNRMGEDAIKAIVTGGRGLMRPVPGITEVELSSVIAYLASTSPNRAGGRGRGGPPPAFPPGPVVARGGAQQPLAPPRSLGPFYPGLGGNAGNYAYPEEAGSVPATRYMSDYGVLASWTKPPYTTLTAYDLNTGEIIWQVPNGDHPPTVAAGGPANTGGLGARNGMVVTKGGLVFHAGGDGKFRAYDQDSGKVLWSAPFSGSAPGVPVSYEIQGAQYVAVIAGPGRRRNPRHERAAGERHDRVCPEAAVSRPERALSVRPQERAVSLAVLAVLAQIDGRVPIEEIVRAQLEGMPDGWHHRQIFSARQMVHAHVHPDHDVLIADGPIAARSTPAGRRYRCFETCIPRRHIARTARTA